MCDELRLPDGRIIDNLGDLRKEVEEVVFDPIYLENGNHVFTDDYCLCCVDLETTAEINGFNYEEDSCLNPIFRSKR